MLCKSCGAQIADGSVFCTVCGAKQNMEEVKQPENEISQEQPVNEIPQEQPVNEILQEEPVNEIPQEQPVNEILQEQPVNEILQEQLANETPQEQSVNGMPQGQLNNGMPQGQWNNGMPQGQWNNGMPQGQPMNGMPQGQPMNGMPQGQPMNGMPQGQWNNGMPMGQPMNGMGYMPAAPKKPFVLPMAVNIIGGILAVAVVAAGICVLIFGAPQADQIAGTDVAVMGEVTPNPRSDQTEDTSFDISSYSFDLEVPESDESANAAALADNYIFYDSDSRYLEETELDGLTEDNLAIAYYEIWARSGLDFSTVSGAEEINTYFLEKTWYTPWFDYDDIDFDNLSQLLNDYEFANITLIDEYVSTNYGSEEATKGDELDQFAEEE